LRAEKAGKRQAAAMSHIFVCLQDGLESHG
jgi:hypothetical protein